MDFNGISLAYFGVDEVFTNLIPGVLIVASFIFLVGMPVEVPTGSIYTESIIFIVLLFLSFVVGLAIQGVSQLFEDLVNWLKLTKKDGNWKKQIRGEAITTKGVRIRPSTYLLEPNDSRLPVYFKNRIRTLASDSFGTPVSESSQHIWELCYSYVIQNNISMRVKEFQRWYIFSRNMIIPMLLLSSFLFYSATLHAQIQFYLCGLGILSIILSLVFYKRFITYGESFAKEVLRSFLLNEKITPVYP